MSYLKTSSDLFIGKKELDRLIRFMVADGYVKGFQSIISEYGIVRLFLDTDFDYFKVEQGTNVGTIKIGSDSYAVDLGGRLIYKEAEDNIAIPNDNLWYWMKIAHLYSPDEEGTVSVDSAGTLTGVSTKFLEVLRGVPNHPSVIKFSDGVLNTGEYEVVSVTSNTSAILSGVFAAENALKYKIVGTFTPGAVPTVAEKDIFQYNSCIPFTVAGGGLVQSTLQPAATVNYQFFIARVKNNAGVITIEDKRTAFLRLRPEVLQSYIDRTLGNPIISAESVKWDNPFTPRDKNQITVGWGFRSSNWTASTSLRQITLSDGDGGLLKAGTITQGFTDGDFDGWRCYFRDGSYSKVISSLIDGTTIKITLDILDPDRYTSGDELVVTPDVEQIEIRVKSDSAYGIVEQIEQSVTFNIRSGVGKIFVTVPVSDEDESTSDSLTPLSTYFVNLQYRYKQFANYTDWLQFPDANVSGAAGTGYYSESSFDEKGVLKSNPADRTRKTYIGSLTLGFVELTPATDSFYNTIQRVDTGDFRGVEHTTIDNSVSVLTLTVGQSRQIQVIDLADYTPIQNLWVNLSKTGAKNGNLFQVRLKTGFVDSFTGSPFTFKFVTDYGSGGTTPPTVLLHELVKYENLYIRGEGGELVIDFVYDGTDWLPKIYNELKIQELLDNTSNLASHLSAGVGVSGLTGTYTLSSAIISVTMISRKLAVLRFVLTMNIVTETGSYINLVFPTTLAEVPAIAPIGQSVMGSGVAWDSSTTYPVYFSLVSGINGVQIVLGPAGSVWASVTGLVIRGELLLPLK